VPVGGDQGAAEFRDRPLRGGRLSVLGEARSPCGGATGQPKWRAAKRFALVLVVCLAAGATAAAPSGARTAMTFCKTRSRALYLLVSRTSCREGRAVVDAIPHTWSPFSSTPTIGSLTTKPERRARRSELSLNSCVASTLSERRWPTIRSGGPAVPEFRRRFAARLRRCRRSGEPASGC
jgi:hypothetical protein